MVDIVQPSFLVTTLFPPDKRVICGEREGMEVMVGMEG